MKFRLRNRQVFLPAAKSKFQLELSSLSDYDPNQAGIGIYLQQDIPNLFAGIAGITSGSATKERVLGTCQRFARAVVLRACGVHDFDASAESRQVCFSSEEGQRRSPVRAFRYLCAACGTVGGNVKPDVCAVNDEDFFLGRFVLPTHAPGL